MRYKWTGADGYPCEFPATPWGNRVKNEIRKLEGGNIVTLERLDYLAQLVGDAIDSGETDEQPWLQQAGSDRSIKQLTKVVELCELLKEEIERINLPAFSALERELNGHPTDFIRHLDEFKEAARCGWSMIEDAPPVKGRPRKHQAEAVAEAAGQIYKEVTGYEVGYTVNPDGGERTGPFVKFLKAIYKIWDKSPSESSQVKKLSTRKRAKSLK